MQPTPANKLLSDRMYAWLKNQATLPTPSAGESVLGFKSDGKLYKKDSSAVETEVGAPTTSIVGITGTKAQFNTAATDGDFLFVGDAPTAHTHTSTDITDFNSASRAQTEAELIAGTNVTITPGGSGATRTLTIAASGGGGLTQADVIGLIIALG